LLGADGLSVSGTVAFATELGSDRLPAASIARTVKLCGPAPSPVTVRDVPGASTLAT
jgi:hypothetical protein